MIRVSVRRNKQNRPVSVEIRGHALFAAYGSDIVCAAVSMLVQTVVFALEDLLGVKPFLRMTEGYMLLSSPKKLAQDKEEQYYLLVETMLLGLQETADAYTANITYREDKDCCEQGRRKVCRVRKQTNRRINYLKRR